MIPENRDRSGQWKDKGEAPIETAVPCCYGAAIMSWLAKAIFSPASFSGRSLRDEMLRNCARIGFKP